MNMRYHTFIFDIDGTITDSAPAILNTLKDLLLEETHKNYSAEELLFALGLPNSEVGKYLGIHNWEELLSQKGQSYYIQYAGAISVFPGMEYTLKRLHEMGCTLGIVTSKTRKQLANGFAKFPCSRLFTCTICADDTPFYKPDPTPLLACMERLGSAAYETIYIGDSRNDMLCAQHAGTACGLALWGQIHSSGIQAGHYIKTPTDLLEYAAP